VREKLEIITVEHADEVLRAALCLEHPEEFLKKSVPPPEAASEAQAQA